MNLSRRRRFCLAVRRKAQGTAGNFEHFRRFSGSKTSRPQGMTKFVHFVVKNPHLADASFRPFS